MAHSEVTRSEVAVDIIVPARNEEDCIGRCLASLINQQGISFRITVVDDGSTDRTRQIAESFTGVRVIRAGEPAAGVLGKANAIITGVKGSTTEWLLFTDADTEHLPGSLATAVREAEERGVDLLSYSPEQEVASLAEKALMPVVFADLVSTYPPERVNNPTDPTVAANGQYILVRRTVYEALGGHQSVANKLLEDVELARIFKASGHKIWFRHGAGIVRTRMYRSFRSMCEGWIKNLTLLFRNPLALAIQHGLEFLVIGGELIGAIILLALHQPFSGLVLLAIGLFFYVNFLLRIRQAHFPWTANLLALFGLPLFVLLLLRSFIHSNIWGEVTWKGRKYRQSAPEKAGDSSTSREQADLKS
ncbi:MAG TPA: glycosyltransferase family 2 protein [Candidatus Angelobacter sp.]|nr:glycosyltransferase family 2 protein [Candidatus Angelobacter sp.]